MLGPALHGHVQAVRNTPGQGNKLVCALPERAVEFRVPQVQLQPGMADFRKSYAVHLIPGRGRVGAALAAADVGGNGDAIGQSHGHSAAQTLEQILIQKARADQGRVEGGQVAQVIVIEVEGQQLDGRKPHAA